MRYDAYNWASARRAIGREVARMLRADKPGVISYDRPVVIKGEIKGFVTKQIIVKQ